MGFESATALGGEAKNPLRNVPRGDLEPAAPLNVISHIYGVSYFRIPLATFGDAGTLAAFGFLLAYFLITIAAPVYLAKRRELRPRHLVIAALAFLRLLVPTAGSFYPLPPYPVGIFPDIFLAYVLGGAIWIFAVSRRRRGLLAEIVTDLENTLHAHEQRPVPAASARRARSPVQPTDAGPGITCGVAVPRPWGSAGALPGGRGRSCM